MDLFEAMEQRHSVRSYTNRKIEGEVKEKIWKRKLDIMGRS